MKMSAIRKANAPSRTSANVVFCFLALWKPKVISISHHIEIYALLPCTQPFRRQRSVEHPQERCPRNDRETAGRRVGNKKNLILIFVYLNPH